MGGAKPIPDGQTCVSVWHETGYRRTSNLCVSAEDPCDPSRSDSSTWHPRYALYLSVVHWNPDRGLLSCLRSNRQTDKCAVGTEVMQLATGLFPKTFTSISRTRSVGFECDDNSELFTAEPCTKSEKKWSLEENLSRSNSEYVSIKNSQTSHISRLLLWIKFLLTASSLIRQTKISSDVYSPS